MYHIYTHCLYKSCVYKVAQSCDKVVPFLQKAILCHVLPPGCEQPELSQHAA